MIAAPTLANESQRIADLRALQILDTPPERRFDRIIELASQVLEVPIAYIAMVDSDRQWFKAKCGLTADQTGRTESFCGHTIAQEDPLIVPDATRDERFHDNPLVLDSPHVRFYAGWPLKGPGGFNVGTLCVVDRKPRSLVGQRFNMFRRLAELAEHEVNLLDVIQTQQKLIETQRELAATQKKLTQELADASRYMHQLVPPPIDSPYVNARWMFISSSALGGDLLGYHDLPDGSVAIYLLDACGHGIGASLLSISAFNVIRSQSLPGADFGDPGSVLASLNEAFPMERHNGRFFTIWYGVFDPKTRQLKYATAGHHPAALFRTGLDACEELGMPGLMIGAVPNETYQTKTACVKSGGKVYVFSDGVFEVREPGNGPMLGYEGFTRVLARHTRKNGQTDRLAEITNAVRAYQGLDTFEDDFSILELEFPPAA